MSLDKFHVFLAKDSQSSLESHVLLHLVDNEATFHVQNNLRPALGIYNVSTLRVLQKVEDLAGKIEAAIRSHREVVDHKEKVKIERELIDYIELAFYAAADHVDDLDLIADNFFAGRIESRRSEAHSRFKTDLKSHKRFIATVANYIKHSQHRIRLFHLEYVHASTPGMMYGYVIESVSNGVVGPSEIFHSSHRSVFSLTSLVWEILVFVLRASRSLKQFLLSTKLLSGPVKTSSIALSDALIAASRLPLYSMDDDHPFASIDLLLEWDDESIAKSQGGIYGSVLHPWERRSGMYLGKCGASFAGDGITRSFRMLIQPSRISLQQLVRAGQA
jgi:hypothetical protein